VDGGREANAEMVAIGKPLAPGPLLSVCERCGAPSCRSNPPAGAQSCSPPLASELSASPPPGKSERLVDASATAWIRRRIGPGTPSQVSGTLCMSMLGGPPSARRRPWPHPGHSELRLHLPCAAPSAPYGMCGRAGGQRAAGGWCVPAAAAVGLPALSDGTVRVAHCPASASAPSLHLRCCCSPPIYHVCCCSIRSGAQAARAGPDLYLLTGSNTTVGLVQVGLVRLGVVCWADWVLLGCGVAFWRSSACCVAAGYILCMLLCRFHAPPSCRPRCKPPPHPLPACRRRRASTALPSWWPRCRPAFWQIAICYAQPDPCHCLAHNRRILQSTGAGQGFEFQLWGSSTREGHCFGMAHGSGHAAALEPAATVPLLPVPQTLAAGIPPAVGLPHSRASTPLLLAMVPARRGSVSHAWRSARANALKVASTMWWLFLPASCGSGEGVR